MHPQDGVLTIKPSYGDCVSMELFAFRQPQGISFTIHGGTPTSAVFWRYLRSGERLAIAIRGVRPGQTWDADGSVYVRSRKAEEVAFQITNTFTCDVISLDWYRTPPREPKPPRSYRDPYTERNSAVVAMRDAGATYEQVGEKFGISRERVRQICRAVRHRRVRKLKSVHGETASEWRWIEATETAVKANAQPLLEITRALVNLFNARSPT